MIRAQQTPILFSAYILTAVVAVAGAGLLAQDAGDYRVIEAGDLTAFEDGVTPRAGVRVNYYTRAGDDQWASSPGQVAIEYGLPVWKPEYDQLFEQFPVSKQWRLGSNFWTNLWTSFPLKTGENRINPGFYYLVLERSSADSWGLLVVQPHDATRQQMDPWHVGRNDPLKGIRVPLQWEKGTEAQEKLEITLKAQDAPPKTLVIHIRFGGFHFWSQDLKVDF